MSYNLRGGFLIVETEQEVSANCKHGRVLVVDYKESGKSAIMIKKNGVFGVHIEDEIYTPPKEKS